MPDITLIDMIPEYNPFSQKWEIRETDERDNEIEVYSFDSSEAADAFVDEWVSWKHVSKPSNTNPATPL